MSWQAPGVWQVSAAAIVVGGLVGAAGAAVRSSLTPWQIGDVVPVTRPIPPDAPQAEVPETRHEFGTIGAGTTGSHRFEIRNVGGGPLTLTRGTTSCSCTVSDFEPSEGGSGGTMVVPRGGSTFVTVSWSSKPPGGFVRRQATILTDDPRRPEIVFSVEGMIVPTWRSEPESIVLPRVTASSAQRASVAVYTYGRQPPVVKQVTIDHPEAERFFPVTTTPLAEDEIASEPGATGGFRIDVGIEPGLPFGPLRKTIRATFAIPEEVTAEVPLEGTVGGDLVLAGPGWDPSRQSLQLGTVSARTGLRTRIFLSARGPRQESVRPVVEERVPESLEVTVGEATRAGSGAVTRFAIDIVIPPGSRPVDHICSDRGPAGRIVLATGHPDEPTLTIPVCVAIGP